MIALLVLLVLSIISSSEGHSEDIRTLLQWVQKTKVRSQTLQLSFKVSKEATRTPYVKSGGDESKFFRNTKGITRGGTNAEAYWSFDGNYFSFQAIRV